MSETLHYIDDYFNGLLQPEEKKMFEERCENEESFALEVAEYIALRESFRNELLAQKREGWKNLIPAGSSGSLLQPEAKVFKMKRWYAIAAAACIIGILLLVIPIGKSGPEQLASEYITKNLQTVSIEMAGAKDSMQTAIGKYNMKQYDSAQFILRDIYSRNNTITEALKYWGLTYLMQHKYDEAILKFEELTAKENLFSNPGLFYKALTLLERNTGADKETAKKLLQEVVDKNLENNREAAEWLKAWK